MVDEQKNLMVERSFNHSKIGGSLNFEVDNWNPWCPVFISAGTGSGKSSFAVMVLVEKCLREKTKILIVTNRIAISKMVETKLEKQMKSPKKYEKNGTEEKYGDYVTVCTYQSLVKKILQNTLKVDVKYIVLDECHYFLSDATFNAYTELCLRKIICKYQKAIRIYMTATEKEILPVIIDMEKRYGFLGKNVADLIADEDIFDEKERLSKYAEAIDINNLIDWMCNQKDPQILKVLEEEFGERTLLDKKLNYKKARRLCRGLDRILESYHVDMPQAEKTKLTAGILQRMHKLEENNYGLNLLEQFFKDSKFKFLDDYMSFENIKNRAQSMQSAIIWRGIPAEIFSVQLLLYSYKRSYEKHKIFIFDEVEEIIPCLYKKPTLHVWRGKAFTVHVK